MNSFTILCYSEDGAFWLCAFRSLREDIRYAVTFPTRTAAMRVKRDIYMPCRVLALRRRLAKQISINQPMRSRKRRRHHDRQLARLLPPEWM